MSLSDLEVINYVFNFITEEMLNNMILDIQPNLDQFKHGQKVNVLEFFKGNNTLLDKDLDTLHIDITKSMYEEHKKIELFFKSI